jgi:type IV pilus assembly protein PilX
MGKSMKSSQVNYPLASKLRSGKKAAYAKVQRGVVLVVALIVLVAMGLAGIAMVRQLSGGLGVAGNLAFKQGATSSGDTGLESAAAWLTAFTMNPDTLLNDMPAQAYFSSWNTTFNPLTYDWLNASKQVSATLASGEKIRYVIHRLCSTPNTKHSYLDCVVAVKEGGTGGAVKDISGAKTELENVPYYRITARVEGARNTLSYVQLMIY